MYIISKNRLKMGSWSEIGHIDKRVLYSFRHYSFRKCILLLKWGLGLKTLKRVLYSFKHICNYNNTKYNYLHISILFQFTQLLINTKKKRTIIQLLIQPLCKLSSSSPGCFFFLQHSKLFTIMATVVDPVFIVRMVR